MSELTEDEVAEFMQRVRRVAVLRGFDPVTWGSACMAEVMAAAEITGLSKKSMLLMVEGCYAEMEKKKTKAQSDG